MLVGKVIGNIWATKKVASLTGQTFLLVAPTEFQGPPMICADQVGAGEGDRVLVVTGSAARLECPTVPVDAAVVGIVDKK